MSKQVKQVAKATYSFAVDGGAVSTITPATNSDVVPEGALVTNVLVDVRTALTSGGSATLEITAGGVQVAGSTPAAYSSAPWNGTVPAALVRSTGLTSTALYIPVRATSSAVIKIVIAGAALTAGIFDVYVEYYLA